MRVELHEFIPNDITTFSPPKYQTFVTVRLLDGTTELVFFADDPDALRRLAEHFGEAADRLTVLRQEPAA